MTVDLGDRASSVIGNGSAGSVNQGTMRQRNLSVILRYVREHGPVSRAQLAAATGLTKPGVAKLVTDLCDRRLLREGTTVPAAGLGRPSLMLHLDGSAGACVAAEINVRSLRVRVFDLAGDELFRAEGTFSLSASRARVLTSLTRLLDRALNSPQIGVRQVCGIGVAVAALVDTRSRLVSAPGLGWSDVDVLSLLKDSFPITGVPMYVDNIARLAAFAEASTPQFLQAHSLVRMEIATGIGAGLVIGGSLERGVAGYAGAIGHIPVASAGPRCLCGRRGCLEAMAGIPALVRAAAPDLADASPTKPGSGATPNELVHEIARRARAGDGRALGGIRSVATWIGRGTAAVINILNPEILVIGGYPLLLQDDMLPVIEAEMDRHVIAPDRGGSRLHISTLGDGAALIGAGEVCRQRILNDPTLVRADSN